METSRALRGRIRPAPGAYALSQGVSGNPRGGWRAQAAARAQALALKEAYRPITVREGDKVMSLPAIQAVMRSQVALAVKGNGPAQRALIAATHALKQELAIEAAEQAKAAAAGRLINCNDAARRVVFLLHLAYNRRGSRCRRISKMWLRD